MKNGRFHRIFAYKALGIAHACGANLNNVYV